MSILKEMTRGTLFLESGEKLAEVRLKRVTAKDVMLILDEEPDFVIPTSVNLVPEEGGSEFESYQCILEPQYQSIKDVQSEDTYYVISGRLAQSYSTRHDFRTEVVFPGEVCFEGAQEPEKILVKDISAGGMRFLAWSHHKEQEEFTFLFAQMKMPVMLRGRVLRTMERSDESIYECGCEFMNLTQEQEAILKTFVFRHTSLSQIEENQ